MRELGPWTYAFVNLAHVFGIALLIGAITVVDLRLLGLWRHTPIGTLTDAGVQVATAGFALAIASGIAMIATNGTEYIGNPFLYVKFPAIGLGLLNAVALRASPVWKARRTRELSSAERRQLAWRGAASLACWLTALAAGRMIGYW
jgi:hypothetical protein